MRSSRAPLAWMLLTTAMVGCAYYNGLFNANRLAADAERAERDGRSGEARSLWAQAAVKAESVATRYPGSGHRDDALLLLVDYGHRRDRRLTGLRRRAPGGGRHDQGGGGAADRS